jgi:hypothetical protein
MKGSTVARFKGQPLPIQEPTVAQFKGQPLLDSRVNRCSIQGSTVARFKDQPLLDSRVNRCSIQGSAVARFKSLDLSFAECHQGTVPGNFQLKPHGSSGLLGVVVARGRTRSGTWAGTYRQLITPRPLLFVGKTCEQQLKSAMLAQSSRVGAAVVGSFLRESVIVSHKYVRGRIGTSEPGVTGPSPGFGMRASSPRKMYGTTKANA